MIPVPAHITLTTDYGLSDPYLAAVKGQLMRQQAGIQITDIAHNISKYNLQEAAYVLKNAYHFFPDGCLHMLDVVGLQKEAVEFIYFEYDKHAFVMPDNGICALLTDNAPLQVYTITQSIQNGSSSFGLLSEVLPAIHPLLNQQKPEELFGPPHADYKLLTGIYPAIQGDMLTGYVLYIDAYENIVTNIDRNSFRRLFKGKSGFTIFLKRSINHENSINQLVNSYEDVDPGEIACYFGYNNLLQIAIRGGKAARLLGLKVNDPILIEKS